MRPFALRAGLVLTAITLLVVGVLQPPVSGVVPTPLSRAARRYNITPQGPTTGWQSWATTVSNDFHAGGGYTAPGQSTSSFFNVDSGQLTFRAVQGWANVLINDNSDRDTYVFYYYNVDPRTNAQIHHLPAVYKDGKSAYLPTEQRGSGEPRAVSPVREEITGWCTMGGLVNMAVWTPNGSGYDLAHGAVPSGTQQSIGFDINFRREVVGRHVAGGVPRAYEWTRMSSGWTGHNLNTPPEVVQSIALSNNNVGQSVGGGTLANGSNVGLIWNGSDVTRVDPPAGFNHFRLNAINDLGVGVGTAFVDLVRGPSVACLYVNGQVIVLNTLIPANSGWSLTMANDISNSLAIGGGGTLNGAPRAFMLTPVFGQALPASPVQTIGAEIGEVLKELEGTQLAGTVVHVKDLALNYLDTAADLLDENPSSAAAMLEAANIVLTFRDASEDAKDRSDTAALRPTVERIQGLVNQADAASR